MAEQLKTVEVVAALVLEDSRVLATQCAPHKHGGGWEFPGGKLEPGELPQEAVVRELAEELGVCVEAGEILRTVEWDYPTFHLRMHCLECRLLSGTIRLHEHVDARWLSADELYSVDWLPADVDVLETLEKRLRQG